MASGAYTGYGPNSLGRRGSNTGQWRDDDRVPALRLRTPTNGARRNSPAAMQMAAEAATIIQPIEGRKRQPFVIRETTCPHLEHRSHSRRCLTGDTREISLDQQVAYCLGPRHRECLRFRAAEGLRTILPQRLTVYTIMIVAMVALIVVAGIQSTRHDNRANDGASTGVEVLGD